MLRVPPLPDDLVADIVLRAMRLGTRTPKSCISKLSVVCRSWQSIVTQNLAEILIDQHCGAMSKALSRALEHNQRVLACELASRPQSEEDSNIALLLAAIHGHAGVVQLLLDAPQHAAAADKLGEIGCRLLLSDAAYKRSTGGMFDILWPLDTVTGLRSCAGKDGQALVEAVRKGHTEIVCMLLTVPQHPARADCKGGQVLVEAVEGEHTAIVCMLVNAPQHAARADCKGGQALVEAVEGGHTAIVCMLVNAPQHPAHADCLGWKILLRAVKRGQMETVRLLLSAPEHAAHADIKAGVKEGGAALVEAARGGHTEIVRLLLHAPQHSAHADCYGGAALVLAARGGYTDMVCLLLDAPKKAACAHGWSSEALEAAATKGLTEIVRLLMDASQYAAQAASGCGHALVLAGRGGHRETVRVLLEYPSHADCWSSKDLVEVARAGHIEV
eukprot:gene21395-biopygen30109